MHVHHPEPVFSLLLALKKTMHEKRHRANTAGVFFIKINLLSYSMKPDRLQHRFTQFDTASTIPSGFCIRQIRIVFER
jgi:hypothetical protein